MRVPTKGTLSDLTTPVRVVQLHKSDTARDCSLSNVEQPSASRLIDNPPRSACGLKRSTVTRRKQMKVMSRMRRFSLIMFLIWCSALLSVQSAGHEQNLFACKSGFGPWGEDARRGE